MSQSCKGHDISVQSSSILLGLAVGHGLITTLLSEEEKELEEQWEVKSECVLCMHLSCAFFSVLLSCFAISYRNYGFMIANTF